MNKKKSALDPYDQPDDGIPLRKRTVVLADNFMPAYYDYGEQKRKKPSNSQPDQKDVKLTDDNGNTIDYQMLHSSRMTNDIIQLDVYVYSYC